MLHAIRGLFPASISLVLAAALACGCSSGKGGRARPAAAAPPAGAETSAPRETEAAPRAAPPSEPLVVAPAHYRDPLIRVNRVIFAFNDVAYRYLLIPLSKGYRRLVPARARRSVADFFHNLKTPVYAANDILQLRPKPLGRHLARFVINSTLGLGGLFDPAQDTFGLPRTRTGFDETLARYGAGYGVYLVLPIYGSSSLRGCAALAADYFLNPIPYLTEDPATTAVMGFDTFQEFAPGAEKYETLRRELEDPYIFFRNLHLQGAQRDAGRR